MACCPVNQNNRKCSKKLITGCVSIDPIHTNTIIQTPPFIDRSMFTPASLLIQPKTNIISNNQSHSSLAQQQQQHLPIHEINRLQIHDKQVGQSFLIDSGADVSVIPKQSTLAEMAHGPPLYAANSSLIRTYGKQLLKLTLNSDKVYYILAFCDSRC